MNKVTAQQTHSEYMLQTLLYITRLVTEGDFGQISSLGISDDQAEIINAMPVEELHELALTMRSNLFKVAFDTDILNSAIVIYQRKTRERREILSMILGGASYANMSAFYGINKTTYSQLRSQAGLSEHDIGRPPVPDEPTQRFIWSVWLQYPDLDDRPRLLAVHAVTKIKVRTLWQLMQEWRSNNLTPAELSPDELSAQLSLIASQPPTTNYNGDNNSDDNPMALH